MNCPRTSVAVRRALRSSRGLDFVDRERVNRARKRSVAQHLTDRQIRIELQLPVIRDRTG